MVIDGKLRNFMVILDDSIPLLKSNFQTGWPRLLMTLRWTDPTAIAVAVAVAKDIALRTNTKCDERVPHVDPQLAGRHQVRNHCDTRDAIVCGF